MRRNQAGTEGNLNERKPCLESITFSRKTPRPTSGDSEGTNRTNSALNPRNRGTQSFVARTDERREKENKKKEEKTASKTLYLIVRLESWAMRPETRKGETRLESERQEPTGALSISSNAALDE